MTKYDGATIGDVDVSPTAFNPSFETSVITFGCGDSACHSRGGVVVAVYRLLLVAVNLHHLFTRLGRSPRYDAKQ